MAPGAGARRVRFAVQPNGAYALQLRLTPALLEALLAAQDAGQAASICFGEDPQSNAIAVGGAAFPFTSVAEKSCDLLHMAPASGSPAIVGAVHQKLIIQRNIEDERMRVRARNEEAERRGQERKAQLLGKPAAKQQGKPRSSMQRVTPPPASHPQQRGATPPLARQQQVTASMLAAPAGKPPTHPAGRGVTPPPQPAAAASPAPKAIHKSASTGKLGGAKHSSAGSMGSLQLSASPLVLRAVRSGASLRLCLIAILAERPMSMNAIKAVLSDAASKVKSFKVPGKEHVERALKNVAEFKAPGMYVLYPVLLKELGEARLDGGGVTAAAERQLSPPVPTADRVPTPKKRRAASAAPSVPAPVAAAAKDGAKVPAKAPATGKRGRLDWTDDDSSDAEQQQQPAVRRIKLHVASVPLAAAKGPHAATSPPVGASSGSGGAGAVGMGVPLRRTSSSRGSDQADESWIEEHADRQPQPAAPIHTKEEYHERAAAFNSKYQHYFELHQLIEAHKRDFEALDAAIGAAASEADRDRHRAELERLHRRRGERAKRWDAAYKVLHQELAAAKERMAEFVRQVQSQAGSVPASAATAVRVK